MENTHYRFLFQFNLHWQTAFWALGFTCIPSLRQQEDHLSSNSHHHMCPKKNLLNCFNTNTRILQTEEKKERAVYHMRKGIAPASLVLLRNLEEAALCTQHGTLGAWNPSQFTTGTADPNGSWRWLFVYIYSTSQLTTGWRLNMQINASEESESTVFSGTKTALQFLISIYICFSVS